MLLHKARMSTVGPLVAGRRPSTVVFGRYWEDFCSTRGLSVGSPRLENGLGEKAGVKLKDGQMLLKKFGSELRDFGLHNGYGR